MEAMPLKEPWRQHPLFSAGVVELVPTSWVAQYWGSDVSPLTDDADGKPLPLETLWQDILSEGLHDPLIMRVGLKNKKFRLEAGNHRIQVLLKHGMREIPVTVQVREECGPHLSDVMTDASHNFDAGDEFLIDEVTQEYMKPSDVFRSLRDGQK